MRLVALLAALLWAGGTWAGGDYAQGYVREFSGADGKYTFRFEQTDSRPLLVAGCPSFTVSVRYTRVPWFSWLPFVHSGHPSRAETDAAAAVIGAAGREERSVNFGYMGYGLVPTEGTCSFVTKGLRMIKNEGEKAVMAFHDQT